MFKSRVSASVGAAPTSNPQDATKQALLAVVQVWLDRLQHQAVVTTFFVSIDSLLFSITSSTRRPILSDWSNKDMVINASLGGAIVFHVCASIVAYVASFVLIRYRLNDAEKKEEGMDRQAPAGLYQSRAGKASSQDPHFTEKQGARSNPVDGITDFPNEVFTDLRGLVGVYRTRPLSILRFGAGRTTHKSRALDTEASFADDAVVTLKDMVGTLTRAHTVCAGMSTLGFVLALLGILTYSWTAVPIALGIFASACMGACGIVAAIALW